MSFKMEPPTLAQSRSLSPSQGASLSASQGPIATTDVGARFRMASLLWVSGITLLLVPMATLVDLPIARWFARQPLPDLVGDTLDLVLFYAHGSGITMILIGVFCFAPTCRWHVPRLAALAVGGGVLSTLTKMFVLRPRPNSLILDSSANDYAWIWSFDWTLEHVTNFDASSRAFPSAYLATATALTVGLWIVLPRGRWLYIALCAGTLLQRLHCGAHFLSDLFGSAAIGLWWSYVCYHPSLMGAIFDKIEPEGTPRRRSWQEIDSAIPSPAPRPITQPSASLGSVPSASSDSGQQSQGPPRRAA